MTTKIEHHKAKGLGWFIAWFVVSNQLLVTVWELIQEHDPGIGQRFLLSIPAFLFTSMIIRYSGKWKPRHHVTGFFLLFALTGMVILLN